MRRWLQPPGCTGVRLTWERGARGRMCGPWGAGAAGGCGREGSGPRELPWQWGLHEPGSPGEGGAAWRERTGTGWPVASGGAAHLVYEHRATEPPPARLLQDGEGAVVPNDHHLHGDALCPGLLPGQPEVEPIPSVVLHDEEGPHCRSSQQGPHQRWPSQAAPPARQAYLCPPGPLP